MHIQGTTDLRHLQQLIHSNDELRAYARNAVTCCKAAITVGQTTSQACGWEGRPTFPCFTGAALQAVTVAAAARRAKGMLNDGHLTTVAGCKMVQVTPLQLAKVKACCTCLVDSDSHDVATCLLSGHRGDIGGRLAIDC